MPDWPHAPIHRLEEAGAFIVTAGTYNKAHTFREPERTAFLHDSLLEAADEHGWRLQAWAVFSNHYHFIGISERADTLPHLVRDLHTRTSKWANERDETPKRKVWFNYWETHLTFPKRYLARLNYVMQNPVRHGLVRVASDYPFCSAAWFERAASASFAKEVRAFKIDRISLSDDF
ncbi:MAG: REP-associated tyrosine transposase [Fimbriimonas sp.]